MLKSLPNPPIPDRINIMLDDATPAVCAAPGVYVSDHLNFSRDIERSLGRYLTFEEEFGPRVDFDYIREHGFPPDRFGVCDSPGQWTRTELGQHFATVAGSYVVAFTPIRADEECERDGWRWHKWGKYIGEGEPTKEYIYDEPILREVYVFHVYGPLPELEDP